MLYSYTFSNFRAFRDPVQVSFRLTPADPVNGWAIDSPSGERLATAMAVIGPNASGKTTLLQPLAFLSWFMTNSFEHKPDAPLGIAPHFTLPHEPSEFEIVLDGDEPGSLFRYRLSVTNERVISESLEKQATLRSKYLKIFDRNGEDGYRIDQADEFGLDPAQAANVRPNVSFISWARQYGVQMVEPIIRWMALSNIGPFGFAASQPAWYMLTSSASHLARNPSRLKKLREFMKKMDLGLSDVEVREVVRMVSTPNQVEPVKRSDWTPYGVHRDGKNVFELPFWNESSGTQTAFNLLVSMLQVIDHGGVMIHDEFDSSLHPHLLEPLLRLFSSSETNPKGAQIIFTTHATETVLRFLQKSQVVLVEKDGINSEAYRLDDVEGVRADENRAARYRAGAYGAIPRV